MPPLPADAWDAPIDATLWPRRALQRSDHGSMGQATPGAQSEDCLFLNIYSPNDHSDKPRPVMVWIHGGGFTAGSANEYDGRVLARQHGVVVVTINYRLGPFGFLNLEPLGDEFRGSASNGIRDMILALEWVRQNIGDYGGDVGNVTVFGESAGAIGILSLLAAPAADGLFHRAIVHSPGAPSVPAGDKTGRMAALLGTRRNDLARMLRELPAEALLEANLPCGHETDRTVVTRPFLAALREGAGVPLIIGTNRTEGKLFTPPDTPDEDMAPFEQLLDRVAGGVARRGNPADYVSQLRAVYPGENAKALFEMISTDHFRRTAIEVAELLTISGKGAWLYRFDLETTIEFRGKLMGAPHACEMAFTFNAFADPDCHVFSMHDPDVPGVRALASLWSQALVRFALSGSPDADSLPQWPRYDLDKRPVLLLDEQCRVANDPDAVHRALWANA